MYKIVLDYKFMGPQMEQQIKRKGHFALQAGRGTPREEVT